MRPKKSFGQHFLVNEHLAKKIVNGLTDQLSSPAVLEVGPGKGVLTKYLLEQSFQFKVVEADRDMVVYLEDHYPSLKDDIVYGDILKVSLSDQFDDQFAVIGNFPYNISTQILFKVLENRARIPLVVGMFQKEVAERVVSGPGSKVYGVTSVLVQAYYEAELLFKVDKRNFAPPPKVQSAVIRLKRKVVQELGCDEGWFRKVVKMSFGQRRKMLRNTLKPFSKGVESLGGISLDLRPEQVGVEGFVAIAKALEAMQAK